MREWEMECVDQRVRAFADTLVMAEKHPRLAADLCNSKSFQAVIPGEKVFYLDRSIKKEGVVKVTPNTALGAAAAYKDKNVAVLNFASHLTPGGGSIFKGTTNTQEECLCRESTLYPCISDEQCMERFYGMHKACEDNIYNTDMIYTPKVTVFKTSKDTIPVLMPESEWFTVDVISMSAPNVLDRCSRSVYDEDAIYEEDELVNLFDLRFSRVMGAAAANNIDVLVLGAFGCGELGNDPVVVATGAARALKVFSAMFDIVEFAIPNDGSNENFRMFRLILDRYLNN